MVYKSISYSNFRGLCLNSSKFCKIDPGEFKRRPCIGRMSEGHHSYGRPEEIGLTWEGQRVEKLESQSLSYGRN